MEAGIVYGVSTKTFLRISMCTEELRHMMSKVYELDLHGKNIRCIEGFEKV